MPFVCIILDKLTGFLYNRGGPTGFWIQLKFTLVGLTLVGICSTAHATFFNSAAFANNGATQTSFYTAAGISSPQWLVDFEAVPVATNVHGNASLFPNLTITTSNSSALITSGAGSIGGSNPIGARALEMAEGNNVFLTFATPVDYIGGFDIDQSGLSLTVFLVGGGSESINLETTAGDGDSAEFWGYVKNTGGPQISSVRFSSVGGASGWGLDNLQYNTPVPEPCTLLALGTGAVALLRRRSAK